MYDPIKDEKIEDYILEPIVPATCSHGCWVEPDGECPHGQPSILIDRGIL